jgi:hypothetical protein
MAGFEQGRPGQLHLVCNAACVNGRVGRARSRRAGVRPFREALNPETPAREPDEGVLAVGEYAPFTGSPE